MALRKILNSNHAVLRGKAAPVKKINSAVRALLDDMAETMYEYKGVGLAAPQIGISRQLVVLDPGEDRLMKLVNPRLVEAEGEESDVEGCLSIPGVYGEVPRALRVLVEALDPAGKPLRFEATDYLARILQHEIDHLHGILFIDRAIRLLEPGEGSGEKEI
ncbi:MAG: peptide deformylase [Dethiobacteria bacterium]